MDRKMLIASTTGTDMRTCEALEHLFSGLGLKVDVANNVFQAQNMIQDNTYHCVIVDSDPSIPDATELLTYAKKHLPNITTVILTNYPSLAHTIDPIESGTDAVFSKPVNEELLLRVVQENLSYDPRP